MATLRMEEGIKMLLDVTPRVMVNGFFRGGQTLRFLADALDEVKLPAATRFQVHFGSQQKISVEVILTTDVGIEGIRGLREKIRDALDRRVEAFLRERGE